MMSNEYYNVKVGLKDRGTLMTLKQLEDMDVSDHQDVYSSIFKYNDKHKSVVDTTKSIAGIKDVVTNTLVWDFDNKTNPELARQDVVTLAHRLVDEYNVDPEAIQCYFSGSKGFHVYLPLDKNINPEDFKSATSNIAKDLKTFDSVVSDPARVIRLEHTKHPVTGLYKIPLSIDDVDTLTIDQIKERAKKNDINVHFNPIAFTIPEKLLNPPKKEKQVTTQNNNIDYIDYTKKPKGMQDYVYALLEGHYTAGERHQALMVLAAKCRALNYDKEATYYLCKSSLKKQAERTNTEEFDKKELWENIIQDSVYSDRWEGGSYSPKSNPWLAKYCDRLKIKWDMNGEANITSVQEAFKTFEHFATNIDNLTIKTGIEGLDENLRLTVGMSAGLVASPGVGKTSISLQMLNNMSKQGHRSVFFSYDMYAPIVYQKLVQKHFKIQSKQMFEKFKTDPNFRNKIMEVISEEYKRVSFCFKTGQTVPDIIDTIKETEDTTGEKVKFIVMDYNELVLTDYSDSTASSSFVAQKMREIAQTQDLCVFSLFQPTKMSGTPADEVKSYSSAKGSGAIAQSTSVMLGMSRPGYNPQKPESDKYINLACLKNRMGPLFSLDFTWEGLTGTIGKMNDDDIEELKQIREDRNSANQSEDW
jgi:hypothetical protein